MKTSVLISAAALAALLLAPVSAAHADMFEKPATKEFDLTKVLPCPPQSNIEKGAGPVCKDNPDAQKADYQGILDARNSANDDEIAVAMADAAYPTVAQLLRPIWLRLVNPTPEACAPAKAILKDMDHDAAIAAQSRLKEDESALRVSLPATAALLGEVNYAEYKASDKAKNIYNRSRPYAVTIDGLPAIAPLADRQYLTRLLKSASYPSGHAVFAFTDAAMLSALLPDNAQIIMNRAEHYGWHRVVVGVHFPTDIAAGKQAGLLVANAYLNDPAMKDKLEAARAELRKALCY
ncbi:phosphatase PAP2 family protein [Parvibaculum sp.]|uniref:phosphatase PAP2 family protein n=1 Tax=Parvibaculum sp. TaxID=2024848 RepID=UPI00320F313D